MKPSNTDTQQVERDIAGTDTDTTTSEQAADLAALQAAAGGTEQGQGAAPAEPEPQGPTIAQELAGLITVAVATLGPMFPSLKATYTKEVTEAASEAIGRVCEKHGWLQGGVFGKWGEEIACAAIIGPLAFQTVQGIKADIAARKPKAPERIEGGALQEGIASGKVVQFGTVAHTEATPA